MQVALLSSRSSGNQLRCVMAAWRRTARLLAIHRRSLAARKARCFAEWRYQTAKKAMKKCADEMLQQQPARRCIRSHNLSDYRVLVLVRNAEKLGVHRQLVHLPESFSWLLLNFYLHLFEPDDWSKTISLVQCGVSLRVHLLQCSSPGAVLLCLACIVSVWCLVCQEAATTSKCCSYLLSYTV